MKVKGRPDLEEVQGSGCCIKWLRTLTGRVIVVPSSWRVANRPQALPCWSSQSVGFLCPFNPGKASIYTNDQLLQELKCHNRYNEQKMNSLSITSTKGVLNRFSDHFKP
jgi:hypothetical protein